MGISRKGLGMIIWIMVLKGGLLTVPVRSADFVKTTEIGDHRIKEFSSYSNAILMFLLYKSKRQNNKSVLP